jgi:flagellar hook protein FlgE
MGLTTALFTSLTGLITHAEAVTVAGDNISNVNTTGFKSSRADFENQIVRNLRAPSGPTNGSGGVNPSQVGLGVNFAGVTRVHTNGSIQATGVNTELAIDGSGFFLVEKDSIQQYTRAGNFKLDSNFNLVSADGSLVQGYGVDSDFNIVSGSTDDISVSLGTATLADATDTVTFSGNLNSDGDVAMQGSIISSAKMFSDAGLTTDALSTDLLTTLFDGAGTSLFSTGDIITVQGAVKGDATMPSHTFEVGATTTTADAAGTTFQDFMTFLEGMLGIDTSVSGGASVVAGALVLTGNSGTVNDLTVEGGNIVVNAGSAAPGLPFQLTRSQRADGESIRTTFFAYDSLGGELQFDMSIVLENKSNTGTSWRFYTESEADSDLSRVLNNGTLSFDTNGQVVSVANPALQIDLNDTGAFTPQQINIRFDSDESPITALADSQGQVNAISQDGSPIGTLQEFSISEDGTIVGIYSNGLIRNQGQIALAQFTNPQGLRAVGGNLYSVTAASGQAAIVTPGSAGTGRIIGGALELSNVELSQEFINLITASTGFSASSRVLTTSDEMIQELLAIVR